MNVPTVKKIHIAYRL